MATPNKRKRLTISLDEKKSILEEAETKTVTQLIAQFNNKYGDSKIRKIIKSKNKIQKAIDD